MGLSGFRWKELKQFVRIFRKTNRVEAYLFATNQYNLIDTLSILLFTVVISIWVTMVVCIPCTRSRCQ